MDDNSALGNPKNGMHHPEDDDDVPFAHLFTFSFLFFVIYGMKKKKKSFRQPFWRKEIGRRLSSGSCFFSLSRSFLFDRKTK